MKPLACYKTWAKSFRYPFPSFSSYTDFDLLVDKKIWNRLIVSIDAHIYSIVCEQIYSEVWLRIKEEVDPEGIL